jgi:hypothetical protein
MLFSNPSKSRAAKITTLKPVVQAKPQPLKTAPNPTPDSGTFIFTIDNAVWNIDQRVPIRNLENTFVLDVPTPTHTDTTTTVTVNWSFQSGKKDTF